MIRINASHFVQASQFSTNKHLDSLQFCHIFLENGKGYIEALNGHLFYQQAIETDLPRTANLLIQPQADLVKAASGKQAKFVCVDPETLQVTVQTQTGQILFVSVVPAEVNNTFPNTATFIAKYHELKESAPQVSRIGISQQSMDIFRKAFGKDAVYYFEFTGEETMIRVKVANNESLCFLMPMKLPN